MCVFADDHLCVDECAAMCAQSFCVVISHIGSPPSECLPALQGDIKQRKYLGNVSPGRNPRHLTVPSLKQTAVSLPLASLRLMSSFCNTAPNTKKKSIGWINVVWNHR